MRGFVSIVITVLAASAHAAPPAGVWAIPDSIAVTADGPFTSAIITGVFTVHSGDGSEGTAWGFAGFEPAAEGYMAYVCTPEDKEACLEQWQRIDDAAKAGGCVGWGEVGLENGVVREHGTATTSFDSWNLADGVVAADSGPCGYLGSADPVPQPVEDTGTGVADPDPDTAPETIDDTTSAEETSVPDGDGGDGAGSADSGGATLDTGPGDDAQPVENTAGEKDDGGCATSGVGLVWGLLLVGVLRRRWRRVA